MNEGNDSKFERVLNRWDIIVLALGAMIGWGWVVSSGSWIESGGVAGAAIGFACGGLMVFFVGLTYAELTSAMPKCGGEHVFAMRAFGPTGSFICTWAIVLGYLGVTCFEACTIPLCISYIWPNFLQGYLYTIAGFDVYVTWIVSAILIGLAITYINIRGIKTAAIFQTIMTLIIVGVGVFMIASGLYAGDAANIENQLFAGDGDLAIKGTLTVMMLTPFFFIGFDVIPDVLQEETDIGYPVADGGALVFELDGHLHLTAAEVEVELGDLPVLKVAENLGILDERLGRPLGEEHRRHQQKRHQHRDKPFRRKTNQYQHACEDTANAAQAFFVAAASPPAGTRLFLSRAQALHVFPPPSPTLFLCGRPPKRSTRHDKIPHSIEH